MKARGLGGGKVVIECDDSYSLVLTEPEHRLITCDNGSRPTRHGTLDRTIVCLIIEDLQPPPGTNQLCNFGQVATCANSSRLRLNFLASTPTNSCMSGLDTRS